MSEIHNPEEASEIYHRNQESPRCYHFKIETKHNLKINQAYGPSFRSLNNDFELLYENLKKVLQNQKTLLNYLLGDMEK